MSVVKQVAKWSGGCIATAFVLGKVVSPYLAQLQRIRTVETIADESIVRRFEQCLREGEARFEEESEHIQTLINNYFNVESIVERIRTSPREEKKNLWQDMKLIVTARLLATIYAKYAVFIVSRAQMILIGKKFGKGTVRDEEVYATCRNFMDEMKAFWSLLTSQLCTLAFEACKDVMLNINLDLKVDSEDAMKVIFYQLKQRTDAVFKLDVILEKFCSSQIKPTGQLSELSIYCQSRNFSRLLDHMICDGLESVSAAGNNYLNQNGKPGILLSWITYFSTIFGNDPDNTVNAILLQKWSKQTKIFSHLAVLFCDEI